MEAAPRTEVERVARTERAECAELRRATVFEPVELLRATYLAHRFAPHAHEEYALGVIERGAARTRLGGRDVLLPAGTVIALPPGTVHDGRAAAEGGWSYRMVYASRAVMSCVAARLGPPADPSALPPFWRTDPSLAVLVSRTIRMLERGPRSTARNERAFVRMMGACLERFAGAPAAELGWGESATIDAVRRVRAYLDGARGVSVSLVELGRLAGLSPYHLNRTFRATVGLPPYKYYELVRVRRARQLIAQGHPLSQVTYAAGFADQSHLTRHFKRIVGLTPGQYARSVEAGRRPSPGTLHAASRRVA